MQSVTLSQSTLKRLKAYADQANLSLDEALNRVLDQTATPQPSTLPTGFDNGLVTAIASTLPHLMIVYRVEGTCPVFVNDAVLAILGYEPASFIDMVRKAANQAVLHHPDDPTILDAITQFKETGETQHARIRIRHAIGTYLWLQVTVTPLDDDYIMVYATDITQHTTTEQKLLAIEDDVETLIRILVDEGKDDQTDVDTLSQKVFMREKRYQDIVETAAEGVWTLDDNACTTYVNRRMADMLGYTIEEMQGEPLWDFITPEARQQAETIFSHHEDGASQHDFCFQHKDGHPVWTSIAISPLLGTRGDFKGTLSIVTNITERKRIEEELRRNNRFINSVTRAAPVIITIFDRVRQAAIYVTGAFESLLGYTLEELQAMDDILRNIVHPDDRERFIAYLKATHIVDNIRTYELRIIPKGGGVRWLLVHDTVFKQAENGEISQFLSIAQDITERKLAEATIHGSEQRLRSLTENAPDIIFSVEIEYQRIEYLNRRDLFGYDLGTFATVSEMVSIVYPDDVQIMVDIWISVLENPHQRTKQTEYRIFNNAGKIEWVQVRLTPYLFDEDDNITHIICQMTPITERKEAEITLLDGIQRERELSAMQARFVMVASHEFRTPLTTILSSADLLKTRYERMTPEWRTRHFDKIEAQVNHMTELMDDVLMVGRLEANTIPINYEQLDVCAVIDEVIETIAGDIHGKTIPIAVECQPNPLLVTADRRLMFKVINNLISNAVKYSSEGAPVHIHAQQDNTQTTITVQDNGIGIPQKDLANLFVPFQRGGNVDTIQGTGLGLSITKHAMELHNGTIHVQSQQGEGSTFTVTMPNQPEQD